MIKRVVQGHSGLHSTYLFASESEALSRLDARAENATDAMIECIFSKIMPDKVSNAEQIVEMASVSQPDSSQALPDSYSSGRH